MNFDDYKSVYDDINQKVSAAESQEVLDVEERVELIESLMRIAEAATNLEQSLQDRIEAIPEPEQGETIAEKRSRRQSVIDGMLDFAIQSGVDSYVSTMFRNLDDFINAWVNTGEDTIISKIQSYDGQWLDARPEELGGASLREVIIVKLSGE